MKYIDLFSGAGGLSEGFYMNEFEPVVHVEMDEAACYSLKTRLTYHYLKENGKSEIYSSYLKNEINRNELYKHIPDKLLDSVICKEINEENIDSVFKKIDEHLGNNKVSVIIGGPPCQAYSNVGRSRKEMSDDPRNYLYKYYIKFLNRYNPNIFVFENVPGLLSANNGSYFKAMMEAFDIAGYEAKEFHLNAKDFGVLQNRKRIIIIGLRRELNIDYPYFDKVENDWTIKELLDDLPYLKPGEGNIFTDYKTELFSDYLKKYNIRNEEKFVTQHVARPHNKRDLQIYQIAIKKWINNKERLKYPDLPKKLKTHNNEKSFIDRFKVVDPDGYSHTVVAHISKDGHHYIYPDVKQVRSLSVREAARIQSFPDSFYFEGGRSSAFRQIGNAVPPLMAEKIAQKIKELLLK